MLEVGQIVWDVVQGKGVVTHNDKTYTYPVHAEFDNGGESTYTSDGKYREEDENPSLYPYPVEIIKKSSRPSIDWEHVRSKFKWLAQDSDGRCWLYEERPDKIVAEWVCSRGDCTSAEGFGSLAPGYCDWKESLVERPAGDNHDD